MEEEKKDFMQDILSGNEMSADDDIFGEAEVADIAFTIHEPRP